MAAILLALAVVALTAYGLERNHHRRLRLGPGLAGSTDTEDRDLARVAADLHAAAAHAATPTHTSHRRAVAPVRSVHPARSA